MREEAIVPKAKLKKDKIIRLEKITNSALKSLDPKKTVVVVAISPIEAHGPHLPLGQDWFEAAALAEETIARAAERWPDWNVLLLPPLPIGCDTIPQAGSINYPAPLVRDIAYYTLRPFAKAGFARLAFSSFHGGPRHFVALEAAADKLSRQYGVAAISFFSVVAKRMMEGNFFYDAIKDHPDTVVTEAQVENDLHAGFTETSFGLHFWPELVEDGWADLPDLVLQAADDPHKSLLFGDKGVSDIISQIKKTGAAVGSVVSGVKHYKQNTYVGYPRLASAEQGRLMFERTLEIVGEIADEFIRKGRDMDVHSPVWPVRELLLSAPINTVLEEWLHFYSG